MKNNKNLIILILLILIFFQKCNVNQSPQDTHTQYQDIYTCLEILDNFTNNANWDITEYTNINNLSETVNTYLNFSLSKQLFNKDSTIGFISDTVIVYDTTIIICKSLPANKLISILKFWKDSDIIYSQKFSDADGDSIIYDTNSTLPQSIILTENKTTSLNFTSTNITFTLNTNHITKFKKDIFKDSILIKTIEYGKIDSTYNLLSVKIINPTDSIASDITNFYLLEKENNTGFDYYTAYTDKEILYKSDLLKNINIRISTSVPISAIDSFNALTFKAQITLSNQNTPILQGTFDVKNGMQAIYLKNNLSYIIHAYPNSTIEFID